MKRIREAAKKEKQKLIALRREDSRKHQEESALLRAEVDALIRQQRDTELQIESAQHTENNELQLTRQQLQRSQVGARCRQLVRATTRHHCAQLRGAGPERGLCGVAGAAAASPAAAHA